MRGYRTLSLVAVATVIAVLSTIPANCEPPATVTWGAAGAVAQLPVTVEVAEPTAAPTLDSMTLRKGMTLKQRRALGATFGNVRRILAEMQQAGEIDEHDTAADLAVAVTSRLVEENPQVASNPALDWEAIIAFIERIIPLILKIIALFS